MNNKNNHYKQHKKTIAKYMSGGINSLSHIHSEKYINLLNNDDDCIGNIAVHSHMIETNFPQQNERQMELITRDICKHFKTLYNTQETFPLFLILGFPVNINAKHGEVFGRSGDKHSIVFSILKQETGYVFEIFDANGEFDAETYQFETYLLDVINNVINTINESEWFKTVSDNSKLTYRQFGNPNINFGAGHCDLLAITYIEGRNRYVNDDNILLDKFIEFNSYTTRQKETIVFNITDNIRNNKSIIRSLVPECFKFPLIDLI
jgi:hypothetical protein